MAHNCRSNGEEVDDAVPLGGGVEVAVAVPLQLLVAARTRLAPAVGVVDLGWQVEETKTSKLLLLLEVPGGCLGLNTMVEGPDKPFGISKELVECKKRKVSGFNLTITIRTMTITIRTFEFGTYLEVEAPPRLRLSNWGVEKREEPTTVVVAVDVDVEQS
jgi:hypothetical protein